MSTQLDEMDPTENPVVEFDFTGELTAIDSALISVVTLAGRHPPPLDLLDGAHQIVGMLVRQRIKSGSGIDQVDYRLRCEATQGADKRVRVGILPVRAG